MKLNNIPFLFPVFIVFSHCFLSKGILRNLVLIASRYHKDDQISEINMVTVKTVEVEPSAGW